MNVLFTFVGNHDPYGPVLGPEREAETGPVLSLLEHESFDEAVLICSSKDYLERAQGVRRQVEELELPVTIRFGQLDLSSPVDYVEIYSRLKQMVKSFRERYDHLQPTYSVLLDPGTPQMQTSWFLLVSGGVLAARLLQGVPPRFAGGAYRVREVDLDSPVLPRVTGIAEEPTARYSAAARPAGGVSVLYQGVQGAAPEPEKDEGGDWTYIQGSPVVSVSEAFRTGLERARRLAKYDMHVLIQGETGTGKELIAKLIHEVGSRSRGPFFDVNCATLGDDLAESELFGHTKGAFTGAHEVREGAFRSAHGGTLFLDEIGDLPLAVQAKLLRVLEDRKVRPLGSDKSFEVDVRVVAASNRDLRRMVEEESFRQDLYQRIAGSTIELPPLRERREDIGPLLTLALDEWNKKYHENRRFDSEALDLLYRYNWPGNVREVFKVVEDSCGSAVAQELSADHLPPFVRAAFQDSTTPALGGPPIRLPADGINLAAYLFQIEEELIRQALARTDGVAEAAAKLLQMQGPTLRKRLRERAAGDTT